MTHRLYHRIFASLLVFVLLALVLSALASHLLLWDLFRAHLGPRLESRAARFARELPGPERPTAELQAAVERLAASWPLHIAVWSGDGQRLAFTTTDLPAPSPGERVPVWLSSRAGPALAVPIPDGRCLVLQARHFPRPGGFLFAVLVLAGLLALASYPVARLVTRRLEALEEGVRRLGEGDLATRVEVSGADELTSLATSFNQAAGRLQRLVEAQRRVLASASHELRSPLARVRMALELARDDPEGGRERIGEAVAEVGEIDAVVEELLLAGRLELQAPPPPAEPIDVGALLVEEAARTGAGTHPQTVRLAVDPRLLRVLLRNLLENARRYGLGSAVEVGVEPLPDEKLGGRVWVADRGPGVPEPERERIFEPFYRPSGHAEGRDGGVGLGLYLVRRIAEAYGGTATCRPREGGGTLFEVTLRPPAVKP